MDFCSNYFTLLTEAIENANDNLVRNIIKMDKNDFVCIGSDVSYRNYSKELESSFEKISNMTGDCNSLLVNTIVDNANVDTYKRVLKLTQKGGVLSDSGIDTMINIFKLYFKKCYCKRGDLFNTVLGKYSNKYFSQFSSLDDTQIIEKVKQDYRKFKELIDNLQNIQFSKSIPNASMPSLSVKGELERLLPEELGTMKQFFITILSTYYEQLHPIVWAQIFLKTCQELFIDLPLTYEEIFSFGSKQLLLNSGPYILKILQMVRPILTPELKNKYNLNKLKYPLLTNKQVDIILDSILQERNMYELTLNISASVGHVCLLRSVKDPKNIIVLKIIKPLSIAQSCWEYKTLSNIFKEGSCEKNFVINMLESNGEELDVNNEKKNIEKGHGFYTCDYDDIFGYNTGHKLTTLEVTEGIIKECWFALTVTLAPGIPLSKLAENDLIKGDTKYRASLHRCLDMLIYSFFNTIFQNGFYHGDLHAGNVFFSFEKKQMTLIDLGSVGEINFFESTKEMAVLTEVLIMSLFSNFGDMLDLLTTFVNTLCPEPGSTEVAEKVDMASPEYKKLREELLGYRKHNLTNLKEDNKKSENNLKLFFNDDRIEKEKYISKEEEKQIKDFESIYSYLNLKENITETVIENEVDIDNLVLEESSQKDLVFILEEIFKFYAKAGINIAIKFADLYKFQKAYALILGVLKQVNYSSSRLSFATKRAILDKSNINKIFHITKVVKVASVYLREKKLAKTF